ncbi:MAG: XRE family transcriptional regulator [Bacteroidetes bacterium]|nr:MAG: XRE family transcriptional regulator [Bacteroidota bacterium]
MDLNEKPIGQRLKIALRVADVTVQEVADALGQSRQSVYKYFHGTSALRADILMKILEAFPQLDRAMILEEAPSSYSTREASSAQTEDVGEGTGYERFSPARAQLEQLAQRVADLERENATLRELVASQREVIALLKGK